MKNKSLLPLCILTSFRCLKDAHGLFNLTFKKMTFWSTWWGDMTENVQPSFDDNLYCYMQRNSGGLLHTLIDVLSALAEILPFSSMPCKLTQHT